MCLQVCFIHKFGVYVCTCRCSRHTHTEIRMDIYLCCALRAFHRREHRRDHVRERARTHPEEKCSKYTPEIPIHPYCISLCVLHFYQTRSRAGYLPSPRYTVRARSHRNTRSSGGGGGRQECCPFRTCSARAHIRQSTSRRDLQAGAGWAACVRACVCPAGPSAIRETVEHKTSCTYYIGALCVYVCRYILLAVLQRCARIGGAFCGPVCAATLPKCARVCVCV